MSLLEIRFNVQVNAKYLNNVAFFCELLLSKINFPMVRSAKGETALLTKAASAG